MPRQRPALSATGPASAAPGIRAAALAALPGSPPGSRW